MSAENSAGYLIFPPLPPASYTHSTNPPKMCGVGSVVLVDDSDAMSDEDDEQDRRMRRRRRKRKRDDREDEENEDPAGAFMLVGVGVDVDVDIDIDIDIDVVRVHFTSDGIFLRVGLSVLQTLFSGV